MRKILIATDFSPASTNALNFGMALAGEMKSSVTVLTAYQVMSMPLVELSLPPEIENVGKVMRDSLDFTVAINRKKYPIEIDGFCESGIASDIILSYSRHHKVDLIVVGMKDAPKGFSRIFGSTATHVAKHTTVPLLVIPEHAVYNRIDGIAYATDEDLGIEESAHVLDSMHEIATHFHSTVYLVRVASDYRKAAFEVLNRPYRLGRAFEDVDTVYEPVDGKNIPKALIDFVNAYKLNLIAIRPHKHSIIGTWLKSSITSSVIHHSSVPVLVIPDKVITARQQQTNREVENWTAD